MPNHKTLLMTNHPPFVKGSDDGIWRRLDIIEFNNKIADNAKDPHFRENKLRSELPGILTWAVRGCIMWRANGLKPSPAVQQTLKDYRGEMDFIQQWIDERTIDDPQASISRSAAYSDYKSWSEDEHTPTLGNRRFVAELKARGFDTAKSGGVRLFKGLRLGPLGVRLHVVGGTAVKP